MMGMEWRRGEVFLWWFFGMGMGKGGGDLHPIDGFLGLSDDFMDVEYSDSL